MKILKKFLKALVIIFIILLVNVSAGISAIRIGFFPNLQTLLVTSTMTTFQHQYLAYIIADSATVQNIMNTNRMGSINENSKKSIIKIPAQNNNNNNSKSPDFSNNDSIQLIDIKGNGYKGHMLIVGNPKRIKLAVTKNLGKSGTRLNDLVQQNNGIGGINAGGFADAKGVGNGGVPTGIIIQDGEVKWDKGPSNKVYSIIGFDYDGILTLGNYSIEQLKELNIKDAISFGPFFIVNGQATPIYGDGGWGINPRTAIGQKTDGTVLLLVIDGRQVSSRGCTIKEVQKIMLQYGAVEAANLDGGSSTIMYYQNKLINHPCSPAGQRPLPDAFIITK